MTETSNTTTTDHRAAMVAGLRALADDLERSSAPLPTHVPHPAPGRRRRAGVGMSARTVAATTALGMYAVAQHMLDHRLPAPTTIDAPRTILGENAVIIYVDSTDSTAWLDSMVVDDERVTPSEFVGTLEHVTFDGRILAVLGEVRIQLRTMRRTIPLQLVGSAS